MGKYVIQLHDASHLHYDLRLEIGGVLKSWALPKGPSLSPKEKRLAVLTTDHQISYGNFEGVISEGYGAGVVLLWDRGTFRNTRDISLESSFHEGKVEVDIRGKKLRGGFALIRFRDKNWLLIKKRDEYAEESFDVVAKLPRSVKSRKTLKEMV